MKVNNVLGTMKGRFNFNKFQNNIRFLKIEFFLTYIIGLNIIIGSPRGDKYFTLVCYH